MPTTKYRDSFKGMNPLKKPVINVKMLTYEENGVWKPVKSYQQYALELFRVSPTENNLMSVLQSVGYDIPLDSMAFRFIVDRLKESQQEVFIQSWDCTIAQVVVRIAPSYATNLKPYERKRDCHE